VSYPSFVNKDAIGINSRTILFNRFSSITEASEPKKLKRGDRFEDRILVSKLKESAPVVRYERQQRAFEKLQSTLKQMNESEALTEHRFKCGVCKENKLV
jgi:hypothetical protein